MSGKAIVIRGNASKLPLPDESVDLIISSPPYFALRSYRDSGEHYDGQIGSEPTPQEWLEALWACMAEWWRCLKPSGSVFVNLGDKRSGSGGHNNTGVTTATHVEKECEQCGRRSKRKICSFCGGRMRWTAEGRQEVGGGSSRPTAKWNEGESWINPPATRRNAPDRYNQAAFGRAKSKMLLPHRFAIGCEDGLADPEGIGWIVRQDLIWKKLNGLPESVTDRHRDSHEFIFHFTKQERYFAAMDEIREAQNTFISGGTPPKVNKTGDGVQGVGTLDGFNKSREQWASIDYNPLGKLPGSVWPMASEPLIIPAWAREKFNLPDHFAAFPTELPRKLILAFSPSGICVECQKGVIDLANDRTASPNPAQKERGVSERIQAGEGMRGLWEEGGPSRLRPPGQGDEGVRDIGGQGSSAEQVDRGDAEVRGPLPVVSYQTALDGGRLQAPERAEASTLSMREAVDGSGDVYASLLEVEAARRPQRGSQAPSIYCQCSGHRETRPAVVADFFAGTGTVPMVAKQLGRIGIGIDLSADYCRLGQWRITHPPSKVMERTWQERQGSLL